MNEFIQPDVAVYCERPEKIIGGYKGRPLIVIEVVSPSTYKIDVTLKKDLYCAYGVEEYWIADPYNKTIRQCTLEHDRYAETIIACGETFDSVIGTIDTALVFQGV
ncbi:Uma2 family endonuclease [Geobacillus sp. FJAT-46040]|nr:Uma2 family endonuclease [Geobacillus sp. FJAT-46040]